MTQTTSHRYEFECDACGAIVGERVTRAGVRYIADLSHMYENGARYSRGAHRNTCAARAAARDERRQAEAAREAANARAAHAFAVQARWMAVYGDDIRAWAAVDAAAAAAHVNAVCDRTLAAAATPKES